MRKPLISNCGSTKEADEDRRGLATAACVHHVTDYNSNPSRSRGLSAMLASMLLLAAVSVFISLICLCQRPYGGKMHLLAPGSSHPMFWKGGGVHPQERASSSDNILHSLSRNSSYHPSRTDALSWFRIPLLDGHRTPDKHQERRWLYEALGLDSASDHGVSHAAPSRVGSVNIDSAAEQRPGQTSSDDTARTASSPHTPDSDRFLAAGFRFAGLANSSFWKHPNGGGAAATQLLLTRVTADGRVYTKPVPTPPWVRGVRDGRADIVSRPSFYRPQGGGALASTGPVRPDSALLHLMPAVPRLTANGTDVDGMVGIGRGLRELKESTSHSFPWSAVGRVTPKCSGALVAPNKVLTAGHCVWDSEQRLLGTPTGDFLPNQHGGDAGEHGHPPRLVRQEYTDSFFVGEGVRACDDGELKCYTMADYQLDFAVITLAESLPEHGAFELYEVCGEREMLVASAGYPAHSPGRLLYDTATVSAFDFCSPGEQGSLVTSDLETHPGQSGSPLWVRSSNRYFIRAIHLASGPVHRGVTIWMAQQIREWVRL